MAPSRATLYHRKTDAARLRAQLDASGLLARVDYVESRGYVVTRTDRDVELTAGRYEVVYSWIRGYLMGRFDATQP